MTWNDPPAFVLQFSLFEVAFTLHHFWGFEGGRGEWLCPLLT